MKKNYCSVYDTSIYWQESRLTIEEKERIAKTVELLPSEAKTVLDVGCGDGRISNQMAKFANIISLDLHHAALKNAGGICVCASAARLPFPNKSFDVVCSTEVLEHLNEKNYKSALKELMRVSRRYLLVSVPLNENLDESSSKCPNCGQKYHLWGHKRQFSPKDLTSLFPKSNLVKMEKCGSIPQPSLTLWVRRHLGGQWPVNRHCHCPECGLASDGKIRKNIVTYMCAAIERLNPLPCRPRWAVCLYQRQQGI